MRSRINALAGLMLGGLAALVAGGLLSGCHFGSSRGAEIVVWLSADTRGYLEPCGCRRDQAGGLPARMTLVTADKKPNRLLLDAGNITNGGRSFELLKFDYLLRGMAAMGYDAVNLGKREVNLDRDTLRSKIAASKLPFVSCNALDRQSGKSLCSPFLIKTVGGTRFGIIGVVQAESDDLGPGIAVRPPIEALAEMLPTVKTQCDFVVVLAFAPSETLHEIATKFPEVGAVLGGDVPQSSAKAETVNRAVLFSVTDKGKVMGKLTFHAAVQSGKTGRAATATLRAVTPNSCVRCHDTENSANFLYAAFWPKIRHGQEANHR